MAATQKKKKSGSRTASSKGGKRTAPTNTKARSGTQKKSVQQPAHRPIRREVGAVVCLLLAIFSSFGYFNMEAIFIDFLCGTLKGLIGYGFWLMPPALLVSSYILAFHHGRPVRTRLICALLFPLTVSCMIHGAVSEVMPWDTQLFITLWDSGELLKSGGVLGGLLGQSCVSLFTNLGSTIIFAMASIIMGLAVFNLSLIDVTEWIFSRPHYEYEPEEPMPRHHRESAPEPVYESRAVESSQVDVPMDDELPAAVPVRSRHQRSSIDIPMDDGPQKASVTQPPRQNRYVQEEGSQPGMDTLFIKKKHSFFDRRPRFPAPDQWLRRWFQEGRPEPMRQPESETVPTAQPQQPPIYTQQATPAAPVQSDPAPAVQPQHVDPVPVYVPQPAAESAVTYVAPATSTEPVYTPQTVYAPQPATSSEPVYEPQSVYTPQPAVLSEPVHTNQSVYVPQPVPAPESQLRPQFATPTAPVQPTVSSSPSVQPVSSAPPVAGPAQVTRQEAALAAAQVTQDIENAKSQENIVTYQYPPLSLLTEGGGEIGGEALAELNANKQRLSDTIHSFGIDANIMDVTRGPSVTRYELELDQGVRLNKLTNLADDIALALGATGVRIAPIPDRISMVGIEVPNKLVSPVNIHTVIGSKTFIDSKSKVSFAVGKDISGNAIVGNIAKMPHLLIAGTTGSGKSVCTNSLIVSLLYKATPEEVRLIMVDPKMVELGIYNGIPHLLIPVVTDPKKAAGALQWTVNEMMKRYRAFSEVGVRDLASYNAKAAQTEGMEKMPQVVVIIDELADLMLVAAKEVEESICRVAQMGRASGMHLIIATQRPSADVITGLMKANIPSRIAFAVASSLESRIILDITGAEKLVGRGDMLYFPLGAGKPTRVQGCLITDQEVAAVVDFVKQSGTAQYDDNVMQEIEQHVAEKEKGSRGIGGSAPDDVDNEYDELIDAATEVVVETGQASVSMLQRRLKLGYARAARLVDQLEEKGIVGPFEGSKPRQLLITKEQWQELKYRQGIPSQSPAPTEHMAPPPVSTPVIAPTPESVPQMSPPVVPPLEDLPPFDMDGGVDRAQEDTL